ncbi:MAG: rod shape-determining protein [Synergistaceae bacterium]|nr:rod shape-determining protein [Synergistaceae bacterium]
MFKFLSGLFSRDVGIDLGTANVVVYVKGRDITLNEPSVVAVRKAGKRGQQEVIAVGREAKAMVGKTPGGVATIRPLQHGVIADFEMTEAMIAHFVSKAVGSRGPFSHPRVIVCVPACVTEVERKAVVDAALNAGAREAFIVEEPVAAALGAGLPIQEPRGSMVLDIGGGTSEVAVLSLGGIVVANSLRAAGDDIDAAIVALMRQNYTLSIGDSMAEEIKMSIGSATPLDEELSMEVKGRDLMDGLPKAVTVTSAEVREALNPIVGRIEDMVRDALEQTPPELSRDIVDQGFIITGGGALLKGLPERLAKTLNIPVMTAEEPLFCVARGLGKVLEELNRMKTVLVPVNDKVGF